MGKRRAEEGVVIEEGEDEELGAGKMMIKMQNVKETYKKKKRNERIRKCSYMERKHGKAIIENRKGRKNGKGGIGEKYKYEETKGEE